MVRYLWSCVCSLLAGASTLPRRPHSEDRWGWGRRAAGGGTIQRCWWGLVDVGERLVSTDNNKAQKNCTDAFQHVCSYNMVPCRSILWWNKQLYRCRVVVLYSQAQSTTARLTVNKDSLLYAQTMLDTYRGWDDVKNFLSWHWAKQWTVVVYRLKALGAANGSAAPESTYAAFPQLGPVSPLLYLLRIGLPQCSWLSEQYCSKLLGSHQCITHTTTRMETIKATVFWILGCVSVWHNKEKHFPISALRWFTAPISYHFSLRETSTEV